MAFRPRKKRTQSPFARKVNQISAWIVLIMLCAFVVWRVVLGFEIHHRFAAIKAAGLPASGEEINLWLPQVPDDQNGAVILGHAFSLLQRLPGKVNKEFDTDKHLFRTNIWSPELLTLIEEFVHTNDPAVAKASEALTLSAFRYPADYSFGPTTPLPHLAKLKTLARVAAFNAALDAERGDINDWSFQVEFELRLAATLDGEPTLISHLVRNSIISTATRTTERCLIRGSLTDEMCLKLQRAFENAGATNTLPTALVGERALSIPVFRLSRAESRRSSQNDEVYTPPQEPQRFSGRPMWFLWASGFFERDLNFYLRTMDWGIPAASRSLPELLAVKNSFADAAVVAQKRYYIMSSLLIPAYNGVFKREAGTSAKISLVASALAIERFKLAHGRLPNDLQELTPEFLEKIPTDPFDNGRLHYRQLAKGYLIYSVGEDGHDDGGLEAPEQRKSGDTNSYDITFTVERP